MDLEALHALLCGQRDALLAQANLTNVAILMVQRALEARDGPAATGGGAAADAGVPRTMGDELPPHI